MPQLQRLYRLDRLQELNRFDRFMPDLALDVPTLTPFHLLAGWVRFRPVWRLNPHRRTHHEPT